MLATIPVGRNTQGMRMINLKAGDRLVGVEIVTRRDLEAFGVTEDEAEGEPEGEGEAPEVPKTPPIEDAPPQVDEN